VEEENNMAKFDAYFALAKEKGIEVFELYYSRAKSLSFKLYNAQIEGYKLSEDISLYARGIYKGKIGYASTEKISKETASFLVNEIITNAGTVTKEELAIIFKGSEKYKKKNFTVLGVSLDDDKDSWLEAIQDDKLSWQHISDLKKWESIVVSAYQIEGIPFNVLIDPTGKVIATDLRGDALQNTLASILQ
jgi:predicted Zn-dependent protease